MAITWSNNHVLGGLRPTASVYVKREKPLDALYRFAVRVLETAISSDSKHHSWTRAWRRVGCINLTPQSNDKRGEFDCRLDIRVAACYALKRAWTDWTYRGVSWAQGFTWARTDFADALFVQRSRLFLETSEDIAVWVNKQSPCIVLTEKPCWTFIKLCFLYPCTAFCFIFD